MARWVKKLWSDDEGPTAVEYGLMLSFIAIVIFGAVQALGLSVQGTFNQMAGLLP